MDPRTPPPETEAAPVPPPAATPAPPPAAVVDRRPVLASALPRHLQTWIMAGLALLILGIILLTGSPTPREPSMPSPSGPNAAAVPADRIRSYQAQLAAEEARASALGSPLGPAPLVRLAPSSSVSEIRQTSSETAAVDDEVRRREMTSLFADNVAFTRRGTVAWPNAPTETPGITLPSGRLDRPTGGPTALPAIVPETQTTAVSLPTRSVPPSTPPTADGLVSITLPEGTAIETVLLHRLDGTFRGPAQVLVTSPVFSPDRQTVAIPAGARILGTAAPVEAWGARRLAVTFHRLLWPDGRSVTLDGFPGLNQIGESGLHDQVNRHYWQVFGASMAIGAIAGLAQVGARAGFSPSAFDGARQSAGAELASATAQVLDRYLNVLPTVTIREGHRVIVMLTRDLVVGGIVRDVVAQESPGGTR